MSERTSTLHRDLHAGQALVVAGVRIELIHKSGKRARLAVTAPRDVKVEVVGQDHPMRGTVEADRE